MSTASVNIPVPSSGCGLAVDVSGMVGEKTVSLSGRYRGAYVLYASHDGTRFAPLLIFNAGGIEGIRQTFPGSFSWVLLKSMASGTVGVSATVSGQSSVGANSFSSLGVGDVLDLGDTSYQVDLNFMCFGHIEGSVVVEGSSDGVGYNPIGEFSATPVGASLLGGGSIEFSPLFTEDKVRYVRLGVQGTVSVGLLVTVGGSSGATGGVGLVGTLSETYDAGVSAGDQTMILDDAKGGGIVFDASGTGYTGPDIIKTIRSDGGTGLEAVWDGSLTVGDRLGNLLIGTPGSMAFTGAANGKCTVVGPGAVAILGDSSVVLGDSAGSGGDRTVVAGFQAIVAADESVVLGSESSSRSSHTFLGGSSSTIDILSEASVLLGSLSHVGDGIISSSYSVICGFECSALGDHSISIGHHSSVGSATVFTGGSTSIGRNTQAIGSQNVSLGDEAVTIGTQSTAVGCRARAGDGIVQTNSSMVFGQDATVLGVESMVFGNAAYVSGDGRVVFDNNTNHVHSFTAFSSMPNGSDPIPGDPSDTIMYPLFSFDESNTADLSSTSLSLLIKNSVGDYTCVPVKLSPPDPYTSVSYLYILDF